MVPTERIQPSVVSKTMTKQPELKSSPHVVTPMDVEADRRKLEMLEKGESHRSWRKP
ncbi:hypothetical protein LR48_Vigan03g174500 [Vigna angularis]|uniref:Uncharacterized protein n=1 Tax=Phaseolus angularis TaxID=3914 RepID=A0A0L9U6A9_PHAAN|nr:hypothetical protein LR48_Vigan03g174500 [Vigna angularis]